MQLSPQYDVDSRENQLQFRLGQLSNVFPQEGFVQRDDLGDVGDGLLRQPGEPGRQTYISGGVGPFHVAGQRDADNGGNSAAVQRIALHDHNRPSEARPRTGRLREIGPPDIALGDHHSLRSKTRCAAEATNLSPSSPTSAQTLSIASVTCSGA